MSDLNRLLHQNQDWSAAMRARDPEFFARLAKGQNPDFLWIGCADSRVSATLLTGMPSGSLFVHRNVANVVAPGDVNALSVIQFAVEQLKVQHIIVCGHYGCGGVQAACGHDLKGMLAEWLCHVEEVYEAHSMELEALPAGEVRENRLCELNVQAQVAHVCRTRVVQNAWRSGQSLEVHGWVYSVKDGLLNPLGEPIRHARQKPHILGSDPTGS